MEKSIPSVSVTYASNGASTKANALGMRPMQERVYEKRGEQYLLIKSPPASGKSRALMFVALDTLSRHVDYSRCDADKAVYFSAIHCGMGRDYAPMRELVSVALVVQGE